MADVPFLSPVSTPSGQQLTGQGLWSECRTCTLNSTTTHTGKKKTAGFTISRNFITKYCHKSPEKGEIKGISPHEQDEREGSLPTTEDRHSLRSGKGLDLDNKPFPGYSHPKTTGIPQGTGISPIECRALPALYLGLDIPIPLFIFQLQTECVPHRGCAVGTGTLP